MKTIQTVIETLKLDEIKEYEKKVESYLLKIKNTGIDISYQTLAAALLMPDIKTVKESEKIRLFAKNDVEYQRFFITLGVKDKLNKTDIMNIIKSKVDNLSTDDFADVYILDNYSFFEVDASFKEEILEKVLNSTHNGRAIHIEYSKMRKKEDKPKKDFRVVNDKKYFK
ncbi:MAG: DbpA RNA binding domain-containing protein [Anaeroplasmataceae bacterium]